MSLISAGSISLDSTFNSMKILLIMDVLDSVYLAGCGTRYSQAETGHEYIQYMYWFLCNMHIAQ